MESEWHPEEVCDHDRFLILRNLEGAAQVVMRVADLEPKVKRMPPQVGALPQSWIRSETLGREVHSIDHIASMRSSHRFNDAMEILGCGVSDDERLAH
jgi:hypothetical protein